MPTENYYDYVTHHSFSVKEVLLAKASDETENEEPPNTNKLSFLSPC